MAKICPYCGRTLAEGEQCTCPQSVLLEHQKNQEPPQASAPPFPSPGDVPEEKGPAPSQPAEGSPSFSQPAPAPRSPSRWARAFENLPHFFHSYFRAPAQTVAIACRHHDWPMGVLFLLLLLASFALFFSLELCQGLRELAYYLSQLSAALPMAGAGGQIALDLPRVILGSILLPLAGVSVFTIGLFLLGKAAKGPLRLQSAFLTVVFSAILPSLLLLAAIPLLYLSLWAAAALAALAFFCWLFLMFHTMHHLYHPAQGGRFCWCSLLFFLLSLGAGALLSAFILEFALDAVSITSPLFNSFLAPAFGW